MQKNSSVVKSLKTGILCITEFIYPPQSCWHFCAPARGLSLAFSFSHHSDLPACCHSLLNLSLLYIPQAHKVIHSASFNLLVSGKHKQMPRSPLSFSIYGEQLLHKQSLSIYMGTDSWLNKSCKSQVYRHIASISTAPIHLCLSPFLGRMSSKSKKRKTLFFFFHFVHLISRWSNLWWSRGAI